MRDFLEAIGIFFGIVGAICAGVFILLTFIGGLIFFTNVGDCNVFVDNQNVYNGPCRYVYVDSVGENGNTKEVSLSKGFLGWFTYKKYISNNVKVD